MRERERRDNVQLQAGRQRCGPYATRNRHGHERRGVGHRDFIRDGDGGTLGVGWTFVSFSVFLAYEFLE